VFLVCASCAADVGCDLACRVNGRGKVEGGVAASDEGVAAASDDTARDDASSIMYTCMEEETCMSYEEEDTCGRRQLVYYVHARRSLVHFVLLLYFCIR
jgi:hypothetical protein